MGGFPLPRSPQQISGSLAAMGRTGRVSGSGSQTPGRRRDRLLRHSSHPWLQSNRPPFCAGHGGGNTSALGRHPATSGVPQQSRPPGRTRSRQLVSIRWKLTLQPRIIRYVGTESKQPKTRAAPGNHKFFANYFQTSEILLTPHFQENV